MAKVYFDKNANIGISDAAVEYANRLLSKGKTTSKNAHGKGFREVQVVQEIEYLGETSTEDLILAELQKQPLPVCILAKRLDIPETTVSTAAMRMVKAGQVTRRKAMVKMNGLRRQVVLYSPTKK